MEDSFDELVRYTLCEHSSLLPRRLYPPSYSPTV